MTREILISCPNTINNNFFYLFFFSFIILVADMTISECFGNKSNSFQYERYNIKNGLDQEVIFHCTDDSLETAFIAGQSQH